MGDAVSGNDVALLRHGTEPYRTVAATLARAGVPFDVRPLPDRPDELYDYDQLILPAGGDLSPAQGAALAAFRRGGGYVVGVGDSALPADRRADAHDADDLIHYGRQVRADGDRLSTDVVRLADGRTALHVVNHGPDRPVALDASLSTVYETATVLHADGRRVPLALRTERSGFRHHVVLDRLGRHAVIVFTGGPAPGADR